jgi:N-acetylneuraminic acid mutarotase
MAETGGLIYAFGGFHNGIGTTLTVNTCYNPSTNSWSSKTALPAARAYHSAVSYGGNIYVIGGASGVSTTTAVATNYMYTPGTNSWTTKASMTVARTGPATAILNSKIHVLGGYKADNTYTAVHEVYNPAANTWSTAAAMPVAIDGHGAVVASGKLYIMGGSPEAVNYQYDEATDSWVKLENAITPRAAAASGYINGSIYLASGYAGGSIASVEAYPLPLSVFHHEKN